MLTLVFAILGSFLLVCQTSLLTKLPAWMGNPDLLFLLVVLSAVRMSDIRGFFLVLFYGLLMDVFSGAGTGALPLLYGGLFLTVRVLSRQMIFDEPTHHPALTAISYLVCHTIIYLYLLAASRDIDLLWSWHALFLAMLIQAVLTLPLFQILQLPAEDFLRRQDRLWLPRRKARQQVCQMNGQEPIHNCPAPSPGSIKSTRSSYFCSRDAWRW